MNKIEACDLVLARYYDYFQQPAIRKAVNSMLDELKADLRMALENAE